MVKTLPVEWDGLSKDLQKGDPVLLSDGLIRLEVLTAPDFEGEIVRCRVEDGGILTERKGINVPRTLVKLPAVGPRDLNCRPCTFAKRRFCCRFVCSKCRRFDSSPGAN